MNNKELRKLRRRDLLEIILEQTKRIENLELELETLKEKYNNRKVELAKVGTLAEASLHLTEIFKAADEAANIYMMNIEEAMKKEEKRLQKEYREKKKKLLDGGAKKTTKKIKNSQSKTKTSKKNVKETAK